MRSLRDLCAKGLMVALVVAPGRAAAGGSGSHVQQAQQQTQQAQQQPMRPVTSRFQTYGQRHSREGPAGDPTFGVIRNLPRGARARLYLEQPSLPVDLSCVGQPVTSIGRQVDLAQTRLKAFGQIRAALKAALRKENVWQTDSARPDANGEIHLKSTDLNPATGCALTGVLPVNAAYTVEWSHEARGPTPQTQKQAQVQTQAQMQPGPSKRTGRSSGRVEGLPLERTAVRTVMVENGSRKVVEPMSKALAQFKGIRWKPGLTHTYWKRTYAPVTEYVEKGGALAAKAQLFVVAANLLKTDAYMRTGERRGKGRMFVTVRGVQALPRNVRYEITNKGTGETVSGRTTSRGSFKKAVPVVGHRTQDLELRAWVTDAESGVTSEVRYHLGRVTYASDASRSKPVVYRPIDAASRIAPFATNIQGVLTTGDDL